MKSSISYRKNKNWDICNIVIKGYEKENIKKVIKKNLKKLYPNNNLDIVDISILSLVHGNIEVTIFFQII